MNQLDDMSRRTILQQGPGPPLHTVTESPVRPADAEVQYLRRELQTCMGKLKGYETLSHLYQESKQECNRYKLQNEELAKQLDSLTTRISPVVCDDASPAPTAHSHTSQTVQCTENLNAVMRRTSQSPPSDALIQEGDNLVKNAVVCSESSMNMHESHHRPSNFSDPVASASGNGFSLTEIGAISPPTRPREKSSESSSSGSPSFVQITNSEAASSASLLSSAFGLGCSNQPEQPNSSYGAHIGVSMQADLSSEINQITERLKTFGSISSVSAEDLAGDLFKAGINTIKLQKQARVHQVMLNQMTSEIAELKADNASKQQTIEMLKKDCDSLRNTVKRMEAAREQAMQQAHVQLVETAKMQDQSTGDSNSLEWVQVENQQISKTVTGAESNETVVTAVPVVEMELRRRVDKLNATVVELVSVNRSWDEHCRQMETKHEQQVNAMQQKLNDMQRRLEEYERNDQQRQLDFDNILLNSKKRLETEEMAKEDALRQLHIERQQREETEQQCVELSRKAAQFEQRLIQLHQSKQAQLTQHLQTAEQVVQPVSAKEQELLTQLLILQEQINVYKEDFDNERRDHAFTKTRLEPLRKQLKEITDVHRVTQARLEQTTSQWQQAKSDCEQWRQRYKKLSDDLQAIQRKARPRDALVTSTVGVPQSSRFVSNQPVSRPVAAAQWMCTSCTFINAGARQVCEMCGTTKERFLESDNASVTGGRHVAGLQVLQPAMLYPRDLETDRGRQPSY